MAKEKTLNTYRVTLYNDTAFETLARKVVFEGLKHYTKEEARRYGETIADCIYGSMNGISVHVEFMHDTAPRADEVFTVTEKEALLLQAVNSDSWYILGGMGARVDTMERLLAPARKALAEEDTLPGAVGRKDMLEGMIWECERIAREYSDAMERLKAAGLKA